MTANGIAYSFRVRRGGTNATVFSIDEDGDYSYDGSGASYDAYDDAHLVRAMATITLDPKTIVRSKWDEMVKYDKQTMIDIGVLGGISPEEEAVGDRGLVNGSQLQRVFMGAHWQSYIDRQEIRELLKDKDGQIAKLEQRLNLLES